MAEKLTRITLYPAPHVEMRIHATEQMMEDYRKCKENAKLVDGDIIECNKCSWNESEIEDLAVCEIRVLERWLKEHG